MAPPELPDPVAVIVGHIAAGELAAGAERVLGVSSIDNGPHVSGDHLEGTWPGCLVIETPAGSDRRLEVGVIEPELQIELWDDPQPSKALGDTELRRRLYVILGRLAVLPAEHAWQPGEPVVYRVTVSVRGTKQPDPASGQPRWLADVLVVMRQPAAA